MPRFLSSLIRRLSGRMMSNDDEWIDESSNGSSGDGVADTAFDTSLPSKHSYLGTLRQISNTPFYGEDQVVCLPFICVPDIVLMPDQEVPVHISPHELDLAPILNEVLDNGFQGKGFVCMASSLATEENLERSLSYLKFGTVAAVIKIEDEEAADQNIEIEDGIRVILRGCQRCVLKKSELRIEGFNHRHYGYFRILPEPGMRPPLRLSMPDEWRSPLSTFSGGESISADIFSSRALYYDVDTEILMEKIGKMMPLWHLDENRPTDPVQFSYWLATVLPMGADRRLQLLGAVSVVHRLYALLMMMRKFTQLNCSVCSTLLAHVGDIICMNRGKLTAAYMNPAGLTQELFTVSQTVPDALVHWGRPTAEFSWFPGYKWRHLMCTHCHTHVGWEYRAENPRTKPAVFCGLKRGDVLPGTSQDTEEEQEGESSAAMTPVYFLE